MKIVDEYVDFVKNQLSEGKLLVDTADVFMNALTLQDNIEAKEYQYQDTIQILLNLLEGGYDPFNFYHTDEVTKAKRLIKEE